MKMHFVEHWFLLLEMVIILICVLLSLNMSITLAIGHLTTCRSIEKFRGCDGLFPCSNFYHLHRANVVEVCQFCYLLFSIL